MQEISNLPVYTGIIPNKKTQTDTEFANNIFGFLNYSGNVFVGNFNTIVGQFNVLSGEINSTASQITLDKQTVLEAKDIAVQAKEAALISKNEAAAIYDNFDDRYLGTKSTPPTLDNDGEPLRNGALYCKESTNPAENGLMYVYDSQLGDWINLSFVPTLFASLTDVVFNGLTDGDILKYDAALGKWKNIPRDYYNKNEIDNNIYTKTQVDSSIASIVGFKNLLINPNFMVNQRAYVSGTATTTANQYCHDRWRIPTSGQNVTFSTVNGVTTVTAPASGYEQIIEDINNIGGTFFLSNQGTATKTVSQSSDNVTYTTVPPNADGSYTVTGGKYIKINFANGTIIKPQFEQGNKATSFEQKTYALELSLCQRYSCLLWSGQFYNFTNGTTNIPGNINYPTVMRTSPSLIVRSGVSGMTISITNTQYTWYQNVASANWTTQSLWLFVAEL